MYNISRLYFIISLYFFWKVTLLTEVCEIFLTTCILVTFPEILPHTFIRIQTISTSQTVVNADFRLILRITWTFSIKKTYRGVTFPYKFTYVYLYKRKTWNFYMYCSIKCTYIIWLYSFISRYPPPWYYIESPRAIRKPFFKKCKYITSRPYPEPFPQRLRFSVVYKNKTKKANVNIAINFL